MIGQIFDTMSLASTNIDSLRVVICNPSKRAGNCFDPLISREPLHYDWLRNPVYSGKIINAPTLEHVVAG